MRHLLLLLSILGLLLPSSPAKCQPDARQILERIDSLQQRIRFETAVIDMGLFEGDRKVRERTLELYADNTRGSRKALAVFTAPADIRGMSLLTIENGSETDQRLYLPALKRIQRITGSRRRESFAGSDFAYEDLRARDPDDYVSSIIGTTDDAWTLAMNSTDDDSPYGRIEATVDRSRFVILEARYFDPEGRLKKVLTSTGFSEYKPGVWKPETMTMVDVQEDRRTELNYLERDTETVIPADTFTERRLRRGL